LSGDGITATLKDWALVVERDRFRPPVEDIHKFLHAHVVATKKLAQLPQWVKVSEVFKTDSDAPFLKRAGMTGFDDPRYEKYSQRLAKLRGIRKYVYRMVVLERTLSYTETMHTPSHLRQLYGRVRDDYRWSTSARNMTAMAASATAIRRKRRVRSIHRRKAPSPVAIW
jgi:hypothetical protein